MMMAEIKTQIKMCVSMCDNDCTLQGKKTVLKGKVQEVLVKIDNDFY